MTDLQILILTIIGESRGEPIEGQVAVGSVIRNRLHSNPNKYKNYSDVCLEPKQFSCWNDNDPNKKYLLGLGEKMKNNIPLTDPHLQQCVLVGNGIYNWQILDNTRGSEYYMTKKIFNDSRPMWARDPKSDPLNFGSQVFFSV